MPVTPETVTTILAELLEAMRNGSEEARATYYELSRAFEVWGASPTAEKWSAVETRTLTAKGWLSGPSGKIPS
jgi:hypothetical protein